MKALLLIFLSIFTCNLYSQWTVVDTVATKYTHIYFYNNSIGFLSGIGFYKKTTDGGVNWTIESLFPNEDGGIFYFINPDTGFRSGEITHDGGLNWVSGNFTYPYCFTENNKYAFSAAFMPFGYSAPTFKSSNYGETWQQKYWTNPINSSQNSGVLDISFSDSLHGIIGALGGDLYYTYDGLDSLHHSNPLGSQDDFTAVYMLNTTCAFACAIPDFTGPFDSYNSSVLRSQDAGRSWSQISSVYGKVNKIRFTDSLNGILCSDTRYLFITHDGGYTWNRETTINNVIVFSLLGSHQVYVLTFDTVFTQGFVFKRDLNVHVPEVTGTPTSKICISPNPAKEYINLEIEGLEEKNDVRIYDVAGNILYQNTIPGGKSTIPISNFVSGVYFISLGGKMERFIKQ